MFVWPIIQLSCDLPGPKFVSWLFLGRFISVKSIALLRMGLIVSLYKINECIACIIQILNF